MMVILTYQTLELFLCVFLFYFFLIHFSYIHLHTEIRIGNQNTKEVNHTVLLIGCGSETQRYLFLI